MFSPFLIIPLAIVAIGLIFYFLMDPPQDGEKGNVIRFPMKVAVNKASRHFDIPFAEYGKEIAYSLIAFVVLLMQHSLKGGVVVAVVILWHEYGHLVAYRLTGRKGNRMMLVPFFGGVAVASAPHKNEYERAFCALGGPAICAPLTLLAALALLLDPGSELNTWLMLAVYYSAILNLLNMLPIYLLDGGFTADAFSRTYCAGRARTAAIWLTGLGLFIVILLGQMSAFIFLAIFGISGLANYPERTNLQPLNRQQSIRIVLAALAIVAVHGVGYAVYLRHARLHF